MAMLTWFKPLCKNASRLSTFVLACCLLSGTAWGDEPPSGIAVGVQGGVTFSSLSTSEFESAGLTGLSLGGNVEFPLTGNFFLQLEMFYLQKGTRPAAGYIVNTLKLSDDVIHYDAIEVPILAKYQWEILKWFHLEFFAGPSAGIAISRTEVQTAPDGGVLPAIDRSNFYSAFDFSIHAGLEMEFEVCEKSSLFVNARYLLGLSNLNNSQGSGNLSVLNSRGILLNVGARFWL